MEGLEEWLLSPPQQAAPCKCCLCDFLIPSSYPKHFLTTSKTSHSKTPLEEAVRELLNDSCSFVATKDDQVCESCLELIESRDEYYTLFKKFERAVLCRMRSKFKNLKPDKGLKKEVPPPTPTPAPPVEKPKKKRQRTPKVPPLVRIRPPYLHIAPKPSPEGSFITEPSDFKIKVVPGSIPGVIKQSSGTFTHYGVSKQPGKKVSRSSSKKKAIKKSVTKFVIRDDGTDVLNTVPQPSAEDGSSDNVQPGALIISKIDLKEDRDRLRIDNLLSINDPSTVKDAFEINCNLDAQDLKSSEFTMTITEPETSGMNKKIVIVNSSLLEQKIADAKKDQVECSNSLLKLVAVNNIPCKPKVVKILPAPTMKPVEIGQKMIISLLNNESTSTKTVYTVICGGCMRVNRNLPAYPGHPCCFCDEILPDQGEYETHMTTYHEYQKLPANFAKKAMLCEFCGYLNAFFLSIEMYKSEPTNIYCCGVCDIVMHFASQLMRHASYHVDAGVPVKCHLCLETLEGPVNLAMHMRELHEYNFVCMTCGEPFPSEEQMKKHCNLHARDNKRKYFIVKPVPGQAKRTKTNWRPPKQFRIDEEFQCNECGKKLRSRTSLQYHIRLHSNNFKYRCDICNKGFIAPFAMQEHKNMHLEKPIALYKCDVCDKEFTRKWSFKIHRRWHDNPYPYSCKICGLKLRHGNLLPEHMRKAHTGERPHKCPHCDQAFLRLAPLRDHIVRKHTQQFPFVCDECGKGYTRNNKYQEHLYRAHGHPQPIKSVKSDMDYKVVVHTGTPASYMPSEADELLTFFDQIT